VWYVDSTVSEKHIALSSGYKCVKFGSGDWGTDHGGGKRPTTERAGGSHEGAHIHFVRNTSVGKSCLE
jgi:hypothetical protein